MRVKNALIRTIDLNADLGEGFPNDRVLLERVTSASVCCGAHAGDPEAICRTLRAAREQNVVVGAHPGFRDRPGFGRRPQQATASEVRDLILDQVQTLKAMAAEAGCPVRFLKPHGALYNQAQGEPAMADGVIDAAGALGLPLLGLPGSLLAQRAREMGIPFIPEGFPDRRLRDDGSPVPRSQPGAVLHDPEEIASQVQNLVEKSQVRTLCLHGDDPDVVRKADLVRSILDRVGVRIRSFLD
jgi:UPF0271 protein